MTVEHVFKLKRHLLRYLRHKQFKKIKPDIDDPWRMEGVEHFKNPQGNEAVIRFRKDPRGWVLFIRETNV